MTDVEQILLNRVKLIGDGEWTLIGTPQELIDEINRLITGAEENGILKGLYQARYATEPGSEAPSVETVKEQLAAIEHERWSDWQKWCHEVLYKELGWSDRLEKVLERWKVQIETPYSELSEKEKQSDREQVDRYLPLINLYIEERERLARIDEVNELDKFLDNQKAVGAVRAWSLQRKQMIKSELEG